MELTFDFDTPIDRTTSDSDKWRKYHGKDIIPMWVADTDFASPPAVLEVLRQRVDHGVFGYASPDPALKPAIIDYLKNTLDWSVRPEWIVWLPGLVCGLNVVCRSVGRSGAGILTTVPIYPPFLTAPDNSGKRLQTTGLVLQNGQWRFDFDNLRRSIDARTALFMLCNPHNPTGRVWTREELTHIATICLEHRLWICSDEIHCDLVLAPGCQHIPLASLSPEVAERTITLMAPSKTYNIPGLGCSFAVISNSGLRQRFKKAMAGIVPHVNLMGFAAALAGYTHGGPWLAAVRNYLLHNRDMVFDRVNALPDVHMAPVEATYLAWIDVRRTAIQNPGRHFEQAGIGLSDGVHFGAQGFVRMNFGCPRGTLKQALGRFEEAFAGVPHPE
ncbi:MAG: putative C-S lyase [Desulfatitalea sp.]|nr:PatB family C-S lyase [Desulfatitalea sp.]NNK01861.1 putative C-S lyase [Desulfatitalea sp.]